MGMSQDWFSYNDMSSEAGAPMAGQQAGGCDSTASCAYHISGSGFTTYGAGAGITLASNNIFDASMYTGFDVWLRGFTKGTRASGYSMTDNSVHVKFVTGSSTDAGADPRLGDDFGFYCTQLTGDTTNPCYTKCHMAFSDLKRDGFRSAEAGAPDPSTDVFDPKNLVKIQFEFSLYQGADGGINEPVSFDIWIDGIAWTTN
jgi:hypothetical protein